MKATKGFFSLKLGILSLAVFSALPLHAESFRTKKTHIIELSSSEETGSVKAGINDFLCFKLPDDMTFVQGIEISFKVPQIVASWQDSVAWIIYDNISPEPSQDCIDYYGTKLRTGTFGNSIGYKIQVPLFSKNTIKKSKYAFYLETVPDISKNFIYARLLLAMKGVPDEIFYSEFSVNAKPIFIDKGRLILDLKGPDGDDEVKEWTAFIDEKNIDSQELGNGKGLLLDTGSHTISLVSDSYRNEVRTVNIEKAKDTVLKINFRDITPSVRIQGPEGTKVYLDGELIENPDTLLSVSQGEHVFRFILGDYEVLKKVKTINGRSYNIAVNFDATITETD